MEKPIVLDKDKAITMPIDHTPIEKTDIDAHKQLWYAGICYLLQDFKNWITERKDTGSMV